MLIIPALAMCVSVTTTNIASLLSHDVHQNMFNQFLGGHNISIINTRNYWSLQVSITHKKLPTFCHLNGREHSLQKE